MSDKLVCVQSTDYYDYFESVKKNTVFLLNPHMAEMAWESEIYANSSSYFNLPDDCWIVASKSHLIGNWMVAYNNDDNASVERILRETVDWSDSTVIKFFVKNTIVFQAKWCDFLNYWDEFIAVEDDCPIIIPENGAGKEALLFRAIGDIIKIG